MASKDPLECNSPEYEAVLQCTQDLVASLQYCIPSVTAACLSKGLISKDVEDYTFTNNPDSQKAARLLACIRESIRIESTKYQAFIEVLEGETYLEGALMKLKEKFSKFSLFAMTSCICKYHLASWPITAGNISATVRKRKRLSTDSPSHSSSSLVSAVLSDQAPPPSKKGKWASDVQVSQLFQARPWQILLA